MAAVHVKTVVQPGSSVNEIVAASVVYLQHVRTDGPMAQVRGGTGHLRKIHCASAYLEWQFACCIPRQSIAPRTELPPDHFTTHPLLQEEWNNASQLRHFSAVRKLDNQQPFPAGAPLLPNIVDASMQLCCSLFLGLACLGTCAMLHSYMQSDFFMPACSACRV